MILLQLILILVSCVYGVQTTPERIKGAIIQFRIYKVTADGAISEAGTKTAYLSSNGNWTTIKRTATAGTEIVLTADANRAGVFIVDDENAATKVSDFLPNTKATSKAQYKLRPQFRGEVTVLGYEAYVERSEDKGKPLSEITWIPFLRQPVHIINFNHDGSPTIEQAVSIELTEPAEDKVKLPAHVIVTGDATEVLHPRPKAP